MMGAVSEADKAFVVKSNMASLFDDMAAAVLKDKPENIPAYLVDWLGKLSEYIKRGEDSQSYNTKHDVDGILQRLREEVLKKQPEQPLPYMASKLGNMMAEEGDGQDGEAEAPPDALSIYNKPRWPRVLNEKALTIVVFGASGDLAWKKTFPALFSLWCEGLLPRHACIVGYARSAMPHDKFIARISAKFKATEQQRSDFLDKCTYVSGQYDEDASFQRLTAAMEGLEGAKPEANRCFYFALPPSVFKTVAQGIHKYCQSSTGWSRMIVEKPFGRDLASAQALATDMGALFREEQIYRIDHYLGKEMVQNVISMRFANKVFSSVWNNENIANVQITFKEPFGTDGRGGYFDQFGIIRDIIQNHLLQVMTLTAMEKPKTLDADAIRDEKVHVLRSIRALDPAHTVLGQYVKTATGEGEAYLDDPTVPKGSTTATFATVVLFVDNDRWSGVPWILKAGKATNERKAEIRIQFKSEILPFKEEAVRDELVLRLQPSEAIYLKLMTKKPGLTPIGKLVQTELDLMYHSRYDNLFLPDAYEGLIYDCLCGNQGNFVRTDELIEAWKIFTPLLKTIEDTKAPPIPYEFGTRGPAESDTLIQKFGYEYGASYTWNPKA